MVVQGHADLKSIHVVHAQIGHQCNGCDLRGASGFAHVGQSNHGEVAFCDGQSTQAFKQARTRGFEASTHAVRLTLGEHVLAFLWSVVHVVLENGIRAVRGVAAQVLRGRRRVANSIPRILTIRFGTTVIGVVEGVEQTEVVAHLVGDGAVQITSRLEFSYKAKSVVKKHDAISGIPCWPEVGKPLGAASSVVAVDFRNHKDVDVVVAKPGGQRFHSHLIRTVVLVVVGNAMFLKSRNHVAIDTHDAVGGRTVGRATCHLKLDVGVRSCAIPEGAWHFSEVFVHSVNGRDDLRIADVLILTNGGAAVDHVHDNRKGVHLHDALTFIAHALHGLTHSFEASCIRFGLGELQGMDAVRATRFIGL